MAHFAKLDENNIVIDVNVVSNEDVQNLGYPDSEAIGIAFLNNWAGQEFNWKQTSYNGNFRKNYAGIGFSYDPDRDAFIEPQPYGSWVLNERTCKWEPPIPIPADNGIGDPPKRYMWDEPTISWVEVTDV